MSLDKTTLKNELKSIFNNATTETNIDTVAEQMANSIEKFIKTGSVTGLDSHGDTHDLTIE